MAEPLSHYDIAVVGAGLAGSAAAAAVARRGWRVLLIEREHFPRHKVCGEFLSPEAQASLANLGLFEAVAELGPVPLTGVEVTGRTGASLRRPLPATAWGLSRYALDAGLAAAAVASGAELWTGTTAAQIAYHAGGVDLQVRGPDHPETVHARTAILAHGRRSQPGLAAKPASSRGRTIGVKCHYAGVVAQPRVELFLFPGGYIGLNPVEDGYVNVCLLASYTAFARAGRTIEGMLEAAQEGNESLAQRLAGAQPVPGTAGAVAPVDTYAPADPWQGTACIGDAAVMLPPLSGDGMASALRSAELCAPLADAYLAGSIGLDEWEETYRRVWAAEFSGRVRVARSLQRLLALPFVADSLLLMGRLLPMGADYFVRATRGDVGGTRAISPAFRSSGTPFSRG